MAELTPASCPAGAVRDSHALYISALIDVGEPALNTLLDGRARDAIAPPVAPPVAGGVLANCSRSGFTGSSEAKSSEGGRCDHRNIHEISQDICQLVMC